MKKTIILKNTTIGYHSSGQNRIVAQNINASLQSGELTCLIGANGTGKSTLLRTLSAFQPPWKETFSYRKLQNQTISYPSACFPESNWQNPSA